MKTVIVAAALILDQERILIAQRREEDVQGLLWEFPGGKVREGEDPRQALQRELKEELDIEVEVGTIFDTNYYVYPQYPVLLLVYRCDLGKGIPRPLGCRDLRWVPVAEMENFPMPPADLPILEKLRSFRRGQGELSRPQGGSRTRGS
jgi:mutator protein MutT